MNVCQSGFKLNASLYVFVFPLLSLSLAQRRVWLGEATKSGAAMAAPAAPAPTALSCTAPLPTYGLDICKPGYSPTYGLDICSKQYYHVIEWMII